MILPTCHRAALCCFALLAWSTSLVSAHAIFYQNVCTDAACTQNCQTTEFPQNECLLTTSGNSAICYCSTLSLVQLQYVFTQNCTQYYLTEKVPLNDCVSGETEYVEYACPNSLADEERRPSHRSDATAPAKDLLSSAGRVARATVKRPSVTPLEGLVRNGLVSLAQAPQIAQASGHPVSHLPLFMFNGSVVVERHVAAAVLDVRCSACAPLVLPPREVVLWFRSGKTVTTPITVPLASFATVQHSAMHYEVRLQVKGILEIQHSTLVDGQTPEYLTFTDASHQEILTLQL